MHRFALIGAGGTGSILLQPLYRFLRTHFNDSEWLLAVIDGDVVETKNLHRQLFDEIDVTVSKAEALVSMLPDENHALHVNEYINDENIKALIPDGTTALIAVDNYPVRARIETHVNTLQNATVINGGNERDTGSCQLWIRREGKNVTPPISFLHPEILGGGDDRAAMTCTQVSALPGGEQTIIANMASAAHMLVALSKALYSDIRWTELSFDLMAGFAEPIDTRSRRGWAQ